nr:hypothetical protein KitaXyl93_16440 [Kitasatospora sp. Xyl93]
MPGGGRAGPIGGAVLAPARCGGCGAGQEHRQEGRRQDGPAEPDRGARAEEFTEQTGERGADRQLAGDDAAIDRHIAEAGAAPAELRAGRSGSLTVR